MIDARPSRRSPLAVHIASFDTTSEVERVVEPDHDLEHDEDEHEHESWSSAASSPPASSPELEDPPVSSLHAILTVPTPATTTTRSTASTSTSPTTTTTGTTHTSTSTVTSKRPTPSNLAHRRPRGLSPLSPVNPSLASSTNSPGLPKSQPLARALFARMAANDSHAAPVPSAAQFGGRKKVSTKVIVPTKSFRTTFELGLSASELARR